MILRETKEPFFVKFVRSHYQTVLTFLDMPEYTQVRSLLNAIMEVAKKKCHDYRSSITRLNMMNAPDVITKGCFCADYKG